MTGPTITEVDEEEITSDDEEVEHNPLVEEPGGLQAIISSKRVV